MRISDLPSRSHGRDARVTTNATGQLKDPQTGPHSSPGRVRSDNGGMGFDALVANAGRLTILTELAVEERQEFVDLRRRTRLTDGNLASHARRLQSAGLIDIDKQFRDGKPVTTYHLTAEGRKALEEHARRLFAAITQRRVAEGGATPAAPRSAATDAPGAADDDWVD